MADEVWYHGSPFLFELLKKGSTITRWRELAAAFSHKPDILCVEDDGEILHNGKKEGFLYRIAEPVVVGKDIFPHPRTTMGKDVEFLTARPLKVERIGKVPPPDGQLEERLLAAIASHRKKENA